jgi:hypothetical protein
MDAAARYRGQQMSVGGHNPHVSLFLFLFKQILLLDFRFFPRSVG